MDPRQMNPMLANSQDDPRKFFGNTNWIAEEKLDGSRYLMHIHDHGSHFTSRRTSTLTTNLVEKSAHLPHLSSTCAGSAGLLGETILDGELVSYDKIFANVMVIMSALPAEAVRRQEMYGKLQFRVFDIPMLNGQDLTKLPLYQRKEILRHVMKCFDVPPVVNTYISMVPWVSCGDPVMLEQMFADVLASGGEGLILKNLDSIYCTDGKRKKNSWAKLKKSLTVDVVIMDAMPPDRMYQGKYESNYYENGVPVTKFWANGWIGAITYGAYVDGVLRPIGQVSGMNEDIRKMLSDGKHGLNKAHYGRVIEVYAMEILPSGVLRHPVFMRFRDDKSSTQCIWED